MTGALRGPPVAPLRGSLLNHGAKGDRIAQRVDSGDAVLPRMPRLALHQIERARLGTKRKALPLVAAPAAEAKLAGAAKREPEDLAEIRFVAMPADADAGLVFGAEYLPHAALRQLAEG